MVTPVAASFAEIAKRIEGQVQSEALRGLFTETQALCREAAKRAASAELRQLLTNVQEALARWHEVWPRLGRQRDVRLAVAREARLWSKKFADAAACPRSP